MAGYSTFVKDMTYIRTEKDYVGGVRNILNGNWKIGITNEDAKAFLIHLTICSLGISSESDIVLCSFGLLAGYERIEGVTGRRLKYMEESRYQGKKTTSTKGRSPEEKSKDLIGKENNLYERIELYCSQISDMMAFFEEAKDRYLEQKANRRGIRRVILPRPSYQTGVPMPLNNLPLANRGFMGREGILATLAEEFKTGETIQLIYGMGGIGKSQIALHYAYTHLKDYGTVAWIDATSVATLHGSCSEFLRKLDPSLSNATEDVARSMFLSYFERGTDWLLIFDNADYLDGDTDESIGARDLLESYLPKSAGHILITTRCNRDFANANRVPINVFTPELAVEFLEKRTGQRPDKDAELLAEGLGYLPLALEYAGSYIKQHTTYSGYLRIWQEHGMELFDQENAGYAERTVREAFRITLEKLRSKYSGSKLRDLTDFLLMCAVVDLEGMPIDAFAKVMADDALAAEIMDDFALKEHVDKLLKDQIRRNELIRIAAEYSLVGWDRHEVTMHPLLRTIIQDEFQTDSDKAWAYGYFDHITLSKEIYELDGNAELAELYTCAEMCRKLKTIPYILRGITVVAYTTYPLDGYICWMTDLLNEDMSIDVTENGLVDHCEETLTWLFEYLDELYKMHVSISMEDEIRRSEKELFEFIAPRLCHNIIYRTLNLPETYHQTGKRYYLGFARAVAPELEAVKIKENNVLRYFDNVDEAKIKVPRLIADENTDWRIIALPTGMEYEL